MFYRDSQAYQNGLKTGEAYDLAHEYTGSVDRKSGQPGLLAAAGSMALAEAPSTPHPLPLILDGSVAMGLAASGAVWPTDLKKNR